MAPFLLGISRKRLFFTVLDTRLCFGQFFNKREKYVKWNFITAAPTRAVVGAAWMSQTPRVVVSWLKYRSGQLCCSVALADSLWVFVARHLTSLRLGSSLV